MLHDLDEIIAPGLIVVGLIIQELTVNSHWIRRAGCGPFRMALPHARGISQALAHAHVPEIPANSGDHGHGLYLFGRQAVKLINKVMADQCRCGTKIGPWRMSRTAAEIVGAMLGQQCLQNLPDSVGSGSGIADQDIVYVLAHGLGAFVLEALARDLLVDPLFKITATSTDGFVELFDEISNFHWFLLSVSSGRMCSAGTTMSRPGMQQTQ